jgi:hypothetical protein
MQDLIDNLVGLSTQEALVSQAAVVLLCGVCTNRREVHLHPALAVGDAAGGDDTSSALTCRASRTDFGSRTVSTV